MFPGKKPFQEQAERHQEAFDRVDRSLAALARGATLADDPAAVTPDRALVFDVVGPVAKFAQAAEAAGFAWLGEDHRLSGDGTEDHGSPAGEPAPEGMSRLYLTLPSLDGLQTLQRHWKAYVSGFPPPDDAKPWWDLFGYLSDVRVWSAKDRIDPSLTSYVEAAIGDDPTRPVRVEVDLWFHGTERQRADALTSLAVLVEGVGGSVLDSHGIPEIHFHGALVSLPAGRARDLAAREGPLAAAASVMSVRPQSSCSYDAPELAPSATPSGIASVPAQLAPPVAALFDGYPVQSHDLLRGAVDIEEIEVKAADAPVSGRFHGTAMASLILHGDLSKGEGSLARILTVVPILAAAPGAHFETTPAEKLPLAMVHRAVTALKGPGGSAPGVVIINHSLCDEAAPFVRRPTAWAKLLDFLSFRYGLLFVVSAGNVHAPVPLPAYAGHAAFLTANPVQRGLEILRAVEAAKGRRGILSPAEAVNVLTVGALHADGAGACPPQHVDPYGFAATNLCSAIGLGVNRAVKPDLVEDGGRQVAAVVATPRGFAIRGQQVAHVGQLAAAPDVHGGDPAYTLRVTGTSNAAALVTRSGIRLVDALEPLVQADDEDWASRPTRAAMVKALLVHPCSWGDVGAVLDGAYPPPGSGSWRRRRQSITRFLGFGKGDPASLLDGSTKRITMLADDQIGHEDLHEYRIPIPAAIVNSRELRRITLTLAWLTPIHPVTTAYRGFALDIVDRKGKRGFWRGVKPALQPHPDDGRRGTLVHVVLEGSNRTSVVDHAGMFVGVQARALHDAFVRTAVPYALAVTVEVGQAVQTDIYAEVAGRVRQRGRQRAQVR